MEEERLICFIYNANFLLKELRRTNLIIKLHGTARPVTTYLPTTYYMARQIRAFGLVLSWSGFRHTDRFRGNVISCVFFAFESRQIQNKHGPSAI